MTDNINNCPRCGYAYKYLRTLKAHCLRKYTCDPIVSNISIDEIILTYWPASKQPIECPNCDKRFASTDSLRKHKLCCKHTRSNHRQAQEAATLPSTIVNNAANINNMMGTNNTNTVNNNTTNNIQIIALGSENLDYIKNNRPFMLTCLKNRTVGVCDLLEMMHYNPATPQNCNVRKLTKKDPHIEIHDGERWTTGLSTKALDKIIRGMEKLIMEFYELNYENDTRVSSATTKRFMEEVGIPLKWSIDGSTHYECDAEYGANIKQSTLDESSAELMLLFKKCLYDYTSAHSSKVDAMNQAKAKAEST